MALPFFYEQLIPETVSHFTLSEETSKHCIQVLRMKVGDSLHITNGKGVLYIASIISEDKKKTAVTIEEQKIIPAADHTINIGISLLKNANRFEWFLEKVTEIGATTIQPFISSRTEHKNFRYDRMNGILIAAMLQSQQVWLPVLHQPITFTSLVEQTTHSQKIIAHCESGNKQFIKDLPYAVNTQILIGPEGDFSPEEIKLALSHQYLSISLGKTRLRTETAGVVAVTLLANRSLGKSVP